MKKLFFLRMIFTILALPLIFFSCTINKPDNTVVTNHSANETVIVKFFRTDIFTLAPGESKTVETILKNGKADMGIDYYSPEKKVAVNNQIQKCDFFDRQSYKVTILNLTGRSGVLSSAFMEEIDFNPLPDEQDGADWLVYSSSPKFTAKTNSGYLLNILFILEGDTFKVTIN
ncbi:MAG: hypothetical protein LBH43_16390 [Treponema sp.]|jgi:hypothetical protein|nr:hypothetical protein [Treponema sp.]